MTFDLADRDGLPDALRALVEAFPRDGWEAHANYSHLIAFWLDRHLMFRRLMEVLLTDAEDALDRRTDPVRYKARVSRFGGMLVDQLHGHHQIEDAHYFPVMAGLDAGVARGVEILDADHHALDAVLAEMTDRANAVLTAEEADHRDQTARLREVLLTFDPLLDRHLVDEEELVVPVLLKYAPEQFR